MTSIKSIVKAFALVVSGVAIVVVGGFMMGAIARLWLPKEQKNQGKLRSEDDADDSGKTD
ncbi:MAG: hypothetical protein E6K98_05250 [Thaumarchaeota archaeon]|nr:MAG: hypothetical protein E6K98_05250 [Nitrososphaerota archaeon]TLX94405.1 MAG: hypothetical protein E6K91_06830 [Nitrososphaerota archaeon]